MLAVLILALATVVGADPVEGSMEHVPSIGEKAVLHDYVQMRGLTSPKVEVWINTTALFRFVEAFWTESARREMDKLDDQELGDYVKRRHDQLTREPRTRGELIDLPDMTAVRVCVVAKFVKPEPIGGQDIPPELYVPDTCLVEVTAGPSKGRFVWASRRVVRVPGAKEPWTLGANLDLKAEKLAPTPAPVQVPTREPADTLKSAPLLVESTSWNRLGDFVQVHCKVRNVADRPLEAIRATVVYSDASGNLVYSGHIIVGDLAPGESKTVSGMDQHSPGMSRYNFEFEGRDEGRMGGLGFTTAGKRSPVRKR